MSRDTSHDDFSRLFVAHERSLYGFVFSLLPNRNEADDVLQDTMAQLWEHFDEFDRSRPFLPWAFRFAYRQVLMHRRKASTRRRFFSDVVVESLAEEYPNDPQWEDLRCGALEQCLGRLSERQLSLVRHRYADGIALVELAKQLSRSVNSLYKSLQRIRTSLADRVRFRLSEEGVS
jgi:RNA polymerase sigma-70 factor (ECF subfamily)